MSKLLSEFFTLAAIALLGATFVQAADQQAQIGADWNKQCRKNHHPTPACKADCKYQDGAQACNVYCADNFHIGNCLTTVSCPGNPC